MLPYSKFDKYEIKLYNYINFLMRGFMFMTAIINILLLVIGFILLLKGADFMVDGAVGFAKKLRIPTLVIGMTIVAFGTSAPEAAVSITAAYNGSNAISVSNVVGSNLFNLLVVGGFCALLNPLPIKPVSFTRDYPFHLLITLALLVLCADKFLCNGDNLFISVGDGIILLLLMCIYMYINITDGFSKDDIQETDDKSLSFGKNLLLFSGGLIAIILGGKLVVESATFIARLIGISDTLIGLTIVAIGTSLPELMTSIVASKKGENDIAWGNIIGSNVFNILFVLGVSSVLHPITLDILSIYDMLILLGVSLLIYPAAAKAKSINRPIGIPMLITYLIYTVYIIVR